MARKFAKLAKVSEERAVAYPERSDEALLRVGHIKTFVITFDRNTDRTVCSCRKRAGDLNASFQRARNIIYAHVSFAIIVIYYVDLGVRLCCVVIKSNAGGL